MGLVVCVTAMHRMLLLAGCIRGSNILIQETLDCNTNLATVCVSTIMTPSFVLGWV